RAELDDALVVIRSAGNRVHDLQAPPHHIRIQIEGRRASGRMPRSQQIVLPPQRERREPRPHERFGGRRRLTAVQNSAALLIGEERTARAVAHSSSASSFGSSRSLSPRTSTLTSLKVSTRTLFTKRSLR